MVGMDYREDFHGRSYRTGYRPRPVLAATLLARSDRLPTGDIIITNSGVRIDPGLRVVPR
jgi:hypothetical protein